ncbi:O-antigen translocase [Pectobacterium versatile]|uniref:O-antigen translocase n=1 Tax=Pectobacterium versatile TaxID=2488639 RepID=UPI0020840D25|nr:LPS biosynthesis protein [Pectobacterium carotovorum subsp. carotovorum]GLX43045.1 LPS biosynthesis protein [Pectobacterium carotovorum subsp. carotovorum]
MKKLLSVTFFSGLLTLAKMGSGFVIAKVVAIYTGPSGMAMLGQIQSIVTSLNGIVNAPVGSAIIRYTAEFEKEGVEGCAPWWKASLWWLAIILSILMPIGFFFARSLSDFLLNDPNYAWIIWITVASLPIAALGTLVNSVINGYQQYRRFVILGAISTAFSCTLMITLIINFGIKGALLAAAIQSGLIGLILISSVLRQPWAKLIYWWGETDTSNKKRIGGYILMATTTALTAPIALIGVRNVLISHVGWEEAGQWQAVWKISEVYLGVITIALSTYYLPKLSTLKGVENIRAEINQTAKIIIPIAAIMALGVYLFRDLAINLLFTEAFRSARELFAIQLIGDIIKITSWLYAYPMLSRGATKWFVSTEIIFSLTLVSLAYVLVPLYSTQGANISYVINYTLYLFFTFIFFGRYSR